MKKSACLVLLLLAACAAPTPTLVPPTVTAIPPTRAPTATLIPPTTTAIPTPRAIALCPAATKLEDLVACATAAMPRRDSNGYAAPSVEIQKDWKSVAAQMLAGQCDDIRLPASLAPVYFVGAFRDRENNAAYCAAIEMLDADSNKFVDRGWATFIVNSNATRELSLHVPHPLADLDTEAQAIGVFKAVSARTYLLAGAHRDANKTRGACQPDTGEGEADAAHNAANLFQTTVEALAEYYDAKKINFTALQFHGMAATTCPGVDVYLTHGSASPPKAGDKILELKTNLLKQNSKWIVTVPGDAPPCTLNATTNVTGRLLNNVPAPNVCAVSAPAYTGKFIHIEQKREMRLPANWIEAIKQTFP